MNAHMQSSLSSLESKLNLLITSLTTSPTAAGAPAAASAVLDADDSLTSAVETLRQHQENYAKILRLRAEAEKLEERVKGIVSDVETREKEIRTICGDAENDTDSEADDDSSDYDSDEDVDMSKSRSKIKTDKEVDYKLLLDFARRISKYNHQAAADAAAGTPAAQKLKDKRQQLTEQDVAMTGINGATETEKGAEPVSSVTKEATSWLDESANMTREIYMLPYPAEDRIRMGLMGQVQLAAAEGRPGFDSDNEVERLIREAEGQGAAEAIEPAQQQDEPHRVDEAAQAAAQAGSVATSGATSGPPPAPKPKATLDLDLYDPEDDEM
ncbi:uncharacterized protein EURHEDRAFT_410210 [Aspergillus ruber CBS 135680]|uniref:Mediator of RNA polymerase II transcription subunit 4 n=1 Tax=Aspergillus ruber (strain CBS 135680) TaxID=1388766 RepID=A0A017SK86_ASPRC|nr:uncharacterized protein EURHEDRAFT_410210 [Aspergillus ruber CBS 135680]EYE97171.1 hypothetical protein EURHEDRAFT_410210 [Aspergillus ruber CBS 135680]